MSSFFTPAAWRRARAVSARTTLIAVSGTAGVSFVAGALAHILGKQKNIRHVAAKKPAQLAWGVAVGSAAPSLGASLKLLAGGASGPSADAIIAEYPLKRPGDIDTAGKNLPPHIAVISALHTARLDLFQDAALIAHEAASLLAVQPAGKGAAILSADDERAAALASHAKASVVWYGAAASADIRLQRLSRRTGGGLAAEVSIGGALLELHLPYLAARHHVQYLLAALAAAQAAGANMKKAVEAAQSYQPPAHMLQRLPGRGGATLLDDTAELTPEDTLQALDTLAELPARRRIAILGSIPQLTLQAAQLHQDIGAAAARATDILITIGDEARLASDVAARAGEQCDVHHLSSAQEAAAWLAPHLKAGDLVLVKMEQRQGGEVLEHLRAVTAPPDKGEKGVLEVFELSPRQREKKQVKKSLHGPIV